MPCGRSGRALSVLRGNEQPGQRVSSGTAAVGMDQLEKLFEAVRVAGLTVEVSMELTGGLIPRAWLVRQRPDSRRPSVASGRPAGVRAPQR